MVQTSFTKIERTPTFINNSFTYRLILHCCKHCCTSPTQNTRTNYFVEKNEQIFDRMNLRINWACDAKDSIVERDPEVVLLGDEPLDLLQAVAGGANLAVRHLSRTRKRFRNKNNLVW